LAASPEWRAGAPHQPFQRRAAEPGWLSTRAVLGYQLQNSDERNGPGSAGVNVRQRQTWFPSFSERTLPDTDATRRDTCMLLR
jgi:hypothetical protein